MDFLFRFGSSQESWLCSGTSISSFIISARCSFYKTVWLRYSFLSFRGIVFDESLYVITYGGCASRGGFDLMRPCTVSSDCIFEELCNVSRDLYPG